MKLLYYSCKGKFSDMILIRPLKESGIEIITLDSLKQLGSMPLDDCRGMIAHPGILNQKEFIEQVREHPDLDVVLFSFSVTDYQKVDGRMPIFDITNAEGIIEHFRKKR